MTTPKATKSNIKNLTCTPDTWDAYPAVDRSNIQDCHFLNLNLDAATKIDRSTLTGVTIAGTAKPEGRSKIERSTITKGQITKSTVEYSSITASDISGSKLDRSEIKDSSMFDCKAERSNVKDSKITGESKLERSSVKNSNVDSAKLERSALSGCEVRNARLSRCNFTDMVLMHGIWERNDLVGRMGKEEVIAMTKADWEKKLAEQRQLDGPGEPANAERDLIDLGATHETTPQQGGQDEKYPNEKRLPPPPVSPTTQSYSHATGFTELELELDSYNGPEIDSPPPYEE